jgi:hypothetical protein
MRTREAVSFPVSDSTTAVPGMYKGPSCRKKGANEGGRVDVARTEKAARRRSVWRFPSHLPLVSTQNPALVKRNTWQADAFSRFMGERARRGKRGESRERERE